MNAPTALVFEKIEKIWEGCVPYSCRITEPMRLYLQSRELVFNVDEVEKSDCLRFHPEMAYYDEDGNEVGKFRPSFAPSETLTAIGYAPPYLPEQKR